jgi:hypothetical protein
MKVLLPIALIIAFLLVYILWGRDWLKKQSWAQGFFAFVEPIEITLFKKSETILFGRLLTGLGAVLTLLTQLGSIDITPLMPFVPEKYHAFVQFVWNLLPLTISGLGMIVEKLRNSTTKPIELVAVPEAKITADVAETIAVADMAKAEAVAAVKAA